jgi:glyoxylase-like metal-dependent hydrolase (beta-lactamase superfamily II)
MAIERGGLIQVEPHIYYLDSRRFETHNVSGVYLVIGDGITIIETATTLVAPYILEAVLELGYKESDIRRAIVTHVHLDHAGGTGWLTGRAPEMQVYVHERGLRHLADPSQLISSAESVYGGAERVGAIHGEILPVPSANLVAVRDAEIDIGAGIELRIFDGPGHASHHLCVFDPTSRSVFSGEALGHNHPEIGVLQPAVSPPGFSLEASLETIGKIRALDPLNICFSQFGQRRDGSRVVEEAERQLREYRDFILTRLERGLTAGQICDEIADLYLGEVLGRGTSLEERHDAFVRSMLMSIVAGYETYFERSGVLS